MSSCSAKIIIPGTGRELHKAAMVAALNSDPHVRQHQQYTNLTGDMVAADEDSACIFLLFMYS